MKIVRFEKRILAYFIDFILPIVFSLVLFFAWLTIYHWPWLTYLCVLELIASFFYVLINAIICYLTKGITLGGLIVRSRVIPVISEQISFKNAFIRYLTLSVFPFVLVNVFFMLSVHTERSIFDRLSDTIVVEANHG